MQNNQIIPVRFWQRYGRRGGLMMRRGLQVQVGTIFGAKLKLRASAHHLALATGVLQAALCCRTTASYRLPAAYSHQPAAHKAALLLSLLLLLWPGGVKERKPTSFLAKAGQGKPRLAKAGQGWPCGARVASERRDDEQRVVIGGRLGCKTQCFVLLPNTYFQSHLKLLIN